jgi:hypothetical protein
MTIAQLIDELQRLTDQAGVSMDQELEIWCNGQRESIECVVQDDNGDALINCVN